MTKILKLRSAILVTGFVFLSIHNASCQKNFNVGVGIGIQEMVHVTAGYQFNQFKLGVSMGSLPEKSSKSITYSGDLYYHFSGKSKYTSVHPWFAHSGVTFRRLEDDLSIIEDSWIFLRAGRDFNFTKKVGMAVDAGWSKRLRYQEAFKRPASSWNLFDISEWPSGAVQIYYRF